MGAEFFEAPRGSNKRMCKYVTAGVVGVLVIVVVVVSLALVLPRGSSDGGSKRQAPTDLIAASCSQTDYVDQCMAAMNSTLPPGSENLGDTSKAVLKAITYALTIAKNLLNVTTAALGCISDGGPLNCTNDGRFNANLSTNAYWAASRCSDDLEGSCDRILDAIDLIEQGKLHDAMDELGVVATVNTDCAELLYAVNGTSSLAGALNMTIELAMHLSNSLKLTDIVAVTSQLNALRPSNRRLMRRRLLSTQFKHVDYVVSKDGTGNYRTVQAALDAVPARKSRESSGGCRRTVIFIKSGKYREKMSLGKKSCPVTLVGEGKTRSVLSWNDNYLTVRDGKPVGTWGSYTFWARGNGFMAFNIGIENTAGGESHQAVAATVQGTKILFVRCGFYGFQDTLYARAGTQYYSECVVTGTVDFIFGNAAAVFFNSNITVLAKNGLATVTAQGRTDPDQPTGYVFRNCRVNANQLRDGTSVTLLATNQYMEVYLGRPWRKYSRVVYIETYLGTIDPEGWLEWQGNDFHRTAEYYEYKCWGPGADRSRRVKWSKALSDREASQFTVTNFLEGEGPWVRNQMTNWWL